MIRLVPAALIDDACISDAQIEVIYLCELVCGTGCAKFLNLTTPGEVSFRGCFGPTAEICKQVLTV